jgi:hypothetical protein
MKQISFRHSRLRTLPAALGLWPLVISVSRRLLVSFSLCHPSRALGTTLSRSLRKPALVSTNRFGWQSQLFKAGDRGGSDTARTT